ncbi:MAG: pro-sigmaK processing inhibitor BofA family protein [Pygmaiobacter massiliensis]|nr:pro-sigmaK processing inhibitor BofA family protein [Pygmaiobacter massiliensis]
MQSLFLAVGLLGALVVAITAVKGHRPVRTALASGMLGVASLGAVNLAGAYTGISIALSYGTALVAVTLGLPGVTLMLMVRFLAML